MSDHPEGLCSNPTCPVCAQTRASAAFRGEPVAEQQQPVAAGEVSCPACGHRFTAAQPQRINESR